MPTLSTLGSCRYVDRPLLLCSGRKFVLRLHLVVACLSPPHAFVSSSGWYARVAAKPYAGAPPGDAAAHLLVAARYQGVDTGGGHRSGAGGAQSGDAEGSCGDAEGRGGGGGSGDACTGRLEAQTAAAGRRGGYAAGASGGDTSGGGATEGSTGDASGRAGAGAAQADRAVADAALRADAEGRDSEDSGGAVGNTERVLCAADAVLALAAAHPHLQHWWPEVWARIKVVLAHVVRLLVHMGGGGGAGGGGGGVDGADGAGGGCGGGPRFITHLASGGCRAAYGVDILLAEDEWWHLPAPPSRAPESGSTGGGAARCSGAEKKTVPAVPLVSGVPPPAAALGHPPPTHPSGPLEPPRPADPSPCEPPLPQPVLLEVNYSPDYAAMLQIDPSFLTGMMERLFLVPLGLDASVEGTVGGRTSGCRATEQGGGARAGGGDGGGRCRVEEAGSCIGEGGRRARGEERRLPINHGGGYTPSCAHWERLHL